MSSIFKLIKNNAWSAVLGGCLAGAGWTIDTWQLWVSVIVIVSLNYWSKLPD